MPYEITQNYEHERLESPEHFDKRSFRTISPNKNTRIVVGCPVHKYCAKCKKRHQCKVGLRPQAILRKV